MRTPLLAFLPFVCFIAGYGAIRSLIRTSQRTVPELGGLLLSEALLLLSQEQLNGFIISQHEDPDLTPTTVIDQAPRAGARLKAGQSIGITIAQQPATVPAPNLVGHNIAEKATSLELGIRIKIHPLPIAAKIDHCYAQCPPVGTQLPKHTTIDAYCASGATAERIMPSFKGYTSASLAQLLSDHKIPVTYFHQAGTPAEGHRCDSCIIIDQKPPPGKLFNLKSPPGLQLLVTPAP